jgi:hypothetical protein
MAAGQQSGEFSFKITSLILDFGQLGSEGKVITQKVKGLPRQLHEVGLGSRVHHIAGPPNPLAHPG